MIRCKDCPYLGATLSPYRNSSSRWRCKIARTEYEHEREIARAKGDVLPIKTSPKWCPLKKVR